MCTFAFQSLDCISPSCPSHGRRLRASCLPLSIAKPQGCIDMGYSVSLYQFFVRSLWLWHSLRAPVLGFHLGEGIAAAPVSSPLLRDCLDCPCYVPFRSVFPKALLALGLQVTWLRVRRNERHHRCPVTVPVQQLQHHPFCRSRSSSKMIKQSAVQSLNRLM